jgi:hypothetical protein
MTDQSSHTWSTTFDAVADNTVTVLAEPKTSLPVPVNVALGSFEGLSVPEIISGRSCMVGFVAAVASEFASGEPEEHLLCHTTCIAHEIQD